MDSSQIYAGGLEINFFDKAKLQKNNSYFEEDALSVGRHALSILMMGWPNGAFGNLRSWRVFKAVFIARDSALLRATRLAFQEGFYHVYSQLKDRQLTELQQRQVELYLSNCLCFLPFADITPDESITIPQYMHGEYVLVEYKVVPIELTPTDGVGKLLLDNGDRVFAYGLEPMSDQDAQSHLIFMGTTYPAGQGFVTQVYTDAEGFQTAGKKIYLTGRERIIKWLDKQNKKPHVCGVSLGGSLSLLLAIDQGDKLSRVDALNPAGLYRPIFKDQYDRWNAIDENQKPAVYVQKQGDDPISRFGYWKNDWHILHVKPQEDRQGPNAFTDHALNYAGFARTQFNLVSTKLDNEERKWRNRLLYAAARGGIYYTLIVPYHYLVQPLLRFSLKHPVWVVLLIASVIFLPYAPFIASSILIGLTSVLVIYHVLRLGLKMMRLFENHVSIASSETTSESSLLKQSDTVKNDDLKNTANLLRHWSIHHPINDVDTEVVRQHRDYLRASSL